MHFLYETYDRAYRASTYQKIQDNKWTKSAKKEPLFCYVWQVSILTMKYLYCGEICVIPITVILYVGQNPGLE